MLVLKTPAATPEQLRVISGTRLGIEVIRGAAGSGKTSTALLRLTSLAHIFIARLRRTATDRKVRILVLTFNRTLAGYVEHLATSQMSGTAGVSYEISTFAAWASNNLRTKRVLDYYEVENIYLDLLRGINLDQNFLLSEIDYICGRFRPAERDQYITAERTGRGATPQVARAVRPQILAAIEKFYQYISARDVVDWHLVTEQMLERNGLGYDVIIVDEAQDFSANQIRAISNHLADPHCLTLVMDTVQRLYPRGFKWAETGLDMRRATYHRLTENHRNTVQIAQFAAGIIDGIDLDDDGTIPDFSAATRTGSKPIVVEGKYGDQLQYAIQFIKNYVDLRTETVAFLKPKGGAWFRQDREALAAAGLPFVDLTRDRDWPQGSENIALSTMHSAKGLEFDHVVIIGLSGETAPIGEGTNDEVTLQQRRLLAMAVGRARKGVLVGYKPGEASRLVEYFKENTFDLVGVGA